jgi:alpha-tubulin suppressor-like RCC1 family protein
MDGARRRVAAILAVAGLAATVTAAAWGTAPPAAAAQVPTVFAWGGNDHGQLGDGTTTERNSRIGVPGLPAGVQQVSVSPDALFSAALAGGTVYAWGANGFGQLGDDSTIDSHSPRAVVGLTGAVKISAGGGFMLAVDSSGAVWSWGLNSSGELGNGTTGPGTNTDVAGRVPGLSGIIAVALGDGTTTNRDTGATTPRARSGTGPIPTTPARGSSP